MNSEIIHKGYVENNKLIFDLPEKWEKKKFQMEGQRFEIIIRKEHRFPTSSQKGYYFGGIIKGTCMKTNLFAGWNEHEIHQFLMQKLRSYPKTIINSNGHELISYYTDNLSDYNRDETRRYIDDVLDFLAEEGIFPEEPDKYLLNKYQYKKKK